MSRSRGRTTLVVLALIVAAVGGVLAGLLWYEPASGQSAQPLPGASAPATSTPTPATADRYPGHPDPYLRTPTPTPTPDPDPASRRRRTLAR